MAKKSIVEECMSNFKRSINGYRLSTHWMLPSMTTMVEDRKWLWLRKALGCSNGDPKELEDGMAREFSGELTRLHAAIPWKIGECFSPVVYPYGTQYGYDGGICGLFAGLLVYNIERDCDKNRQIKDKKTGAIKKLVEATFDIAGGRQVSIVSDNGCLLVKENDSITKCVIDETMWFRALSDGSQLFNICDIDQCAIIRK